MTYFILFLISRILECNSKINFMKTKSLLLLTILGMVILSPINAQTVKKEKLKFGGYGQKKFNKAGKKIFIEQFNISYQFIYGKTKKTRGGRQMGGGYLGDSKAALFLGLDGIKTEELQKLTNDTYTDFTLQLQAKGYTILTGEDFKNHTYYKDAKLFEGGTPNEYFKGFISTSPEGVAFLNKEYTDFNTTLKTSKQLDGVVIARINVIIPFAEDGESQGSRAFGKLLGGVSKVVAKPNLRIGSSTIQTKSKLGFDKYNTVSTNFDIGFYTSLKYQAWQTAKPKKAIEISGVLPEKKYKAVKTASQDLNGTQAGNYKVFNIPSSDIEKMQLISFEGTKYYKGVKEGLTYFIKSSTNKFLSNVK